jgi:hypothetical protein
VNFLAIQKPDDILPADMINPRPGARNRVSKLANFWKAIDWNQRDIEIARQFQVNRASVFEMRKKLFENGFIHTCGKAARKLDFKRGQSHAILLDILPGGSIRLRMPTLGAGKAREGLACSLAELPEKIKEGLDALGKLTREFEMERIKPKAPGQPRADSPGRRTRDNSVLLRRALVAPTLDTKQ